MSAENGPISESLSESFLRRVAEFVDFAQQANGQFRIMFSAKFGLHFAHF